MASVRPGRWSKWPSSATGSCEEHDEGGNRRRASELVPRRRWFEWLISPLFRQLAAIRGAELTQDDTVDYREKSDSHGGSDSGGASYSGALERGLVSPASGRSRYDPSVGICLRRFGLFLRRVGRR